VFVYIYIIRSGAEADRTRFPVGRSARRLGRKRRTQRGPRSCCRRRRMTRCFGTIQLRRVRGCDPAPGGRVNGSRENWVCYDQVSNPHTHTHTIADTTYSVRSGRHSRVFIVCGVSDYRTYGGGLHRGEGLPLCIRYDTARSAEPAERPFGQISFPGCVYRGITYLRRRVYNVVAFPSLHFAEASPPRPRNSLDCVSCPVVLAAATSTKTNIIITVIVIILCSYAAPADVALLPVDTAGDRKV